MNNRIRELRKQHKMTMKELGAVVGLAESTISQYETGKRQPDNETLLKLGEYFKDFTCPAYTGRLKGENIRIIMERNGLSEAVNVGDTQGDANSCKEAEIPMIYAAYGFGKVEKADASIQSFDELLDMDFDRL